MVHVVHGQDSNNKLNLVVYNENELYQSSKLSPLFIE